MITHQAVDVETRLEDDLQTEDVASAFEGCGEDPLGAARGILLASVISVGMWAMLLWASLA